LINRLSGERFHGETPWSCGALERLEENPPLFGVEAGQARLALLTKWLCSVTPRMKTKDKAGGAKRRYMV